MFSETFDLVVGSSHRLAMSNELELNVELVRAEQFPLVPVIRKVWRWMAAKKELADRVGFEPTVSLHPRRFSRPLP